MLIDNSEIIFPGLVSKIEYRRGYIYGIKDVHDFCDLSGESFMMSEDIIIQWFRGWTFSITRSSSPGSQVPIVSVLGSVVPAPCST